MKGFLGTDVITVSSTAQMWEQEEGKQVEQIIVKEQSDAGTPIRIAFSGSTGDVEDGGAYFFLNAGEALTIPFYALQSGSFAYRLHDPLAPSAKFTVTMFCRS